MTPKSSLSNWPVPKEVYSMPSSWMSCIRSARRPPPRQLRKTGRFVQYLCAMASKPRAPPVPGMAGLNGVRAQPGER